MSFIRNQNSGLEFNEDNCTISNFYLDEYFCASKTPIYIVIFEEYSKANPLCKELKLSSVFIEKSTSNSVIATLFHETGESSSKVLSKFSVEVKNDIISIGLKITLNPLNKEYRFGVVIPSLECNSILYAGKEINPTSVVNFHKTWDRKWPTETYIDFPAITFIQDDRNISLLINSDYNSQLFFHNENVRATTSTARSNDLSLFISKHETDIRDHYLALFPNADHLINSWKTQITKICDKHGVHITHSVKPTTESNIAFDLLSHQDINSAVKILHDEMFKYPFLLSSLGLKEIILCSILKINDGEKSGFLLRDSNMFLTYTNPNLFARTFHHEMFHLIQSKIDLNPHKEVWDKIIENDVDGSCGFVEDSAKLFGQMMTDYIYIQSLEQNVDMASRIKIIENIFSMATKKTILWRKKPTSYKAKQHELDISHINKNALLVNKNLMSNKPIIKNNESNLILICGFLGSGVKLVNKYLEKQNIISITDIGDLSKVGCVSMHHYLQTKTSTDALTKRLNSKIVCMLRNPGYYAQMQNNILNDWLDVHSFLFGSDNILFIKYENLIMNDQAVIKSICDFVGVPWERSISFIDYDKTSPTSDAACDLFFRQNSGNPFLEMTGYI